LRIARSGLVDIEYYRAQTGRRFLTALGAALHYLRAPASAGLSLHPLFEPAFLPSAPAGAGDPLMRYLTTPALYRKVSPHPAFDLAAAKRALRAAGVPLRGGAWRAWVRSAGPTTVVPVRRGGATVSWQALRAAVIEAALNWRSGDGNDSVVVSPSRSAGLTSIVVPITGRPGAEVKRLSLLDGDSPRELICTGFTSRATWCSFTALALIRPVRVIRDASSALPDLWNRGAAAGAGDRLVFVAPQATLTADAAGRLADALTAPGTAAAQPLNERVDMTIASAGAYFAPDEVVPAALLAAHPTTDAERLGTAVLPAARSAVLAVRTDAFLAVRGFDPAFADCAEVDLALRLAAAGLGRTVLVPTARTTVSEQPGGGVPETTATLLRARHQTVPTGSAALVEAAGFVVTGHHPSGPSRVHEPELARAQAGVAALPTLRWTIDTAMTAGWWARSWGDWHFAHSLAAALRRLGQQVAVDTNQARGRPTRRFDDVVLVLRGREAVQPASVPVNLLWVISHPAEVTSSEAGAYDAVFAASTTWAAERSEEWGLGVEPLLQCTDPELFHPGRAVTANDHVLFVGNARRGGQRPIVDAAVASGVPLDLYGTGWDDGPAAAHLIARRAKNTDLGRLYAEAGIVLNDHWDDMRRLGFVSNRLFDAVACGARVLSDEIVGAKELFDGSVRCADTSDAIRLLTEPVEANWPRTEQRVATAARVRREHSFDERAKVLLARAVETLRGR
jgi:hypothetical protein